MRKLVVAGVLGLATLWGPQASAFSMSLMLPGSPAKVAKPTDGGQPLVLVQSGDATMQIQQLQEEIRTLNGRIEEMSFQLLQMQEQMRKTQEDNEFRFQELEKGGVKKSGAAEAPPATDDVARIIDTPAGAAASTGEAGAGTGERTLGSIELDQNGAPVGATTEPGSSSSASTGGGSIGEALPGVDTPAPSGNQTASLGSEGETYQVAYGHVLSGDYALAEQEFQTFLKTYPSSAKAADANFWMGEALYSQGKFNESAKVFLNAHQTFGKSSKAPEMLLKLGMSLAALDNTDTACATLREVSKRYPKASRAVINKVASEQKRLAC